jgi:DNA-directed RNA polymerase specialized sigma54-like protein
MQHEPRISPRPEQTLRVSAKLITASTILQLSSDELERTINQEQMENPALEVNTSHLKPKGGKRRQESSKSGILPESKKPRSFRCTDYAKWKSMTRCVNR